MGQAVLYWFRYKMFCEKGGCTKEDVILLVILVSVLYLLLCLLIAFIRALFPGKRSRKSCFKDTFWMFFLEILNPLNWL